MPLRLTSRRTPPGYFSSACLALLICLAMPAFGQDIVSVKSPDGSIEFRLLEGPPTAAAGTGLPHLSYQVDFRGKRLIDTSGLGFDIYSQLSMGDKPGLVDTLRESKDETYTLVAGKTKLVRNHYNEVIAEYMQNGSLGRRMTIIVRAFDDGVAFRYFIPVSPPLEEMLLEQENTQFVFAQDAESYPLFLRGFATGYEDQVVKLPLSAIHPDTLIGLPFLVHQPGVAWLALTEADIDEYPGMYLTRTEETGNPQAFQARLSPLRDGSRLALRERTPLASPWRVFLIHEDPAKLLESNIVTSLNAASKLTGTEWIQAGKTLPVAGSAMNGDGIRRMVDLAASSGIEYLTLNAGWAAAGEGNTPDLLTPIAGLEMQNTLAYAKQKKVGIWLWAPWQSVDSQMDAAFSQFEKWGIRGVQIDAMNRDDAWMVNWYRKVAQSAADHHLMLDFHGAFKPDGMNRTFPNVLTREAVLGSEYSAEGARVTAEHDVQLAYTRLLAGAMDFAPGNFNNVTPEQFRPDAKAPMALGTRAHQLALYVLFESPLQTVATDFQTYTADKETDFVRRVPASWDETRGIQGEVGEYIAVARRRGSEWYLGAITNGSPRSIAVPLDFLGTGNFIAEIYKDANDAAADPKHVTMVEQEVVPTGILALTLGPGGGAAVRFRPGTPRSIAKLDVP